MRLFTLCLTVLICACAVGDPPAPANESALDEGAAYETQANEGLGEARSAVSANGICRDVCVSLGVAGCAGVTFACVAGTPLTLGGVTIPCAVAVPLACGSGLGCADACFALFPLSPEEAAGEW